jgi:hypothetical protein
MSSPTASRGLGSWLLKEMARQPALAAGQLTARDKLTTVNGNLTTWDRLIAKRRIADSAHVAHVLYAESGSRRLADSARWASLPLQEP